MTRFIRAGCMAMIASLAGCSHFERPKNTQDIVAVAKAYTAMHPVCLYRLILDHGRWTIGTRFGGAWVYNYHRELSTAAPFVTMPPEQWEAPMLKAGLLLRMLASRRTKVAGTYTLLATPRLRHWGPRICIGHVVVDAVVAANPQEDPYAKIHGISGPVLDVAFRTHFAYAHWANDQSVRSAFWDMTIPAIEELTATRLHMTLYRYPSGHWRIIEPNLLSQLR